MPNGEVAQSDNQPASCDHETLHKPTRSESPSPGCADSRRNGKDCVSDPAEFAENDAADSQVVPEFPVKRRRCQVPELDETSESSCTALPCENSESKLAAAPKLFPPGEDALPTVNGEVESPEAIPPTENPRTVCEDSSKDMKRVMKHGGLVNGVLVPVSSSDDACKQDAATNSISSPAECAQSSTPVRGTSRSSSVESQGNDQKLGEPSLSEDTPMDIVPEVPTSSTSSKSDDLVPSSYKHRCPWAMCQFSCDELNELPPHIVSSHVTPANGTSDTVKGCGHLSKCQWRGCPSDVLRPDPNLWSHVLDHLLALKSTSEICPSTSVRHIQHWENEPVGLPSPPATEYALSGTVRLTAALVLLNIARHTPSTVHQLHSHEDRLVNLTCTASEAAPTLARLLAELHQSAR